MLGKVKEQKQQNRTGRGVIAISFDYVLTTGAICYQSHTLGVRIGQLNTRVDLTARNGPLSSDYIARED